MDVEIKEALKSFSVWGLAIIFVYQLFAKFNSNAPIRKVINPSRRNVLLGGLGVTVASYGALALVAGNKWSPADTWAIVEPLFNEEKTPLRAILAVGGLTVGLIVLAGPALFCYVVYPRDPRTFAPSQRHPQAIRAAAEDALCHYTNRPGGLEYAAIIVLPRDGTFPTAEQLIESATPGVTVVGEYRLIEHLSRSDTRRNDKKWLRQKADKEKLHERRIGWLNLAITSLQESRRVSDETRACDLGEIDQVRVSSSRGGLIFAYLLPCKTGEPEVILFGVTTSADEVLNGRLELHFSMLKEALAGVIRETSDLGILNG